MYQSRTLRTQQAGSQGVATARTEGASGSVTPTGAGKKSRVVLVRDSQSVGRMQKPGDAVLSGMFNRAIVALTDEPAIPRAFEEVLRVGGVVLIKTAHGVHEGILEPLVRGLLTSGVSAGKIVLYRKAKRGAQENGEGLEEFAGRYGVRAAESRYRHDSEKVGKLGLHLDDIFYECDSIINVTVLGVPGSVAVGTNLASHVDSVRETEKVRRGPASVVMGLNGLEPVRQKTRLFICDALEPVAVREGRTVTRSVPYGGLVVGRDPVALDALGTTIISRCRAGLGLEHAMLPTWGTLATAAKMGLGNCDPALIDLVQIDV